MPDIERRFLIRIYGDSLSLPRPTEHVHYYETYPEILASRWRASLRGGNVHLYVRSFSGATAPALYETYRSDSFFFGRPGGEFAVLHIGIVDCAPRPIPPWLRAKIGRMPQWLRKRAVRFLHNNRPRMLRSGLSWRIVSPAVFMEMFKQTLAMAVHDFERVYVVNIAPTTPSIEAQSPGLTQSIDHYNSLINSALREVDSKHAILLDLNAEICATPDGLKKYVSQIDGHHITLAAHVLLADMISKCEQRFGLLL